MRFTGEAPLIRRKPERSTEGKARPRFWVSMLLLIGVMLLGGLGQWDLVVAVVIGLLVGNVGAWLLGQD